MPGLATNLRRAEQSYRNASVRAETARVRRDAVVFEAIAAGWTHQRIADVLGVTRGRVNQIAMRRPNR